MHLRHVKGNTFQSNQPMAEFVGLFKLKKFNPLSAKVAEMRRVTIPLIADDKTLAPHIISSVSLLIGGAHALLQFSADKPAWFYSNFKYFELSWVEFH